MVLLRNAHLHAPQDQGVQDLLVVYDKVVAIGKHLTVQLPNLEIIDLEGAPVIPGLIDQHVHITGGGGEMGFASRVPEIQLSDIVNAGVTTVVGLFGTDTRTRTMANLVAKTKALQEEGLSAYCLTGGYEYPSITLSGTVADDVLFIDEVLGVKIAISDHRCSHLPKQDLIALAAQTRIASLIAKKPGVVHLHVGSAGGGIDVLFDIVKETNIPIAHFRPTHAANFLDQIPEFTALGGYVDFTSGRDADKAASLIASMTSEADYQRMTLSSDANGSLPVWSAERQIIGLSAAKMSTLYETILSLVGQHGFSLSKALMLVTEHVSRALNFYPRKGTLQEGSDADLLVLDDKLRIVSMMAGGRFLKREGQMLAKGTFE